MYEERSAGGRKPCRRRVCLELVVGGFCLYLLVGLRTFVYHSIIRYKCMKEIQQEKQREKSKKRKGKHASKESWEGCARTSTWAEDTCFSGVSGEQCISFVILRERSETKNKVVLRGFWGVRWCYCTLTLSEGECE